jgi:glycosyltransferase involved in cell wall biosynthesis
LKFAAVIPTRGRDIFLNKCLEYVQRQTRKADHVIVVDYPAKDSSIDIVPRYMEGFKKAFDLYGCDLAICIEDDDWYSDKYFEFICNEWERNLRPDVLGINHTIYYNIISNEYTILKHPGRASMMSMAVSPKVLEMDWCADNYAYLDFHIWTKVKTLKKISVQDRENLSIGIKHGKGLCGGGGHVQGWKHYTDKDMDWSFFKSIVNNDINFYQNV